MPKRLRLNGIQKELDQIMGVIKSDYGDDQSHLKKAEQCLMAIEKDLKNALEVACQDLKRLKTVSPRNMAKTEQAAGIQIGKIRDMIGYVNAILNHCRRLSTPNRNGPQDMVQGAYEAIRKSHNSVSSLDLTKQTIRLLNRQQSGAEGNIAGTIEFPVPDLGLATHQRNGGILEKIRLGSDVFDRKRYDREDMVLMPHFYHEFSREDDWIR